MTRIGVKYCGGCNPRIDRTALAAEIARLLPAGFRLEAARPPGAWDVGILLCGCPAACADRPEVRALARRWVRVEGGTVDCEAVPQGELAARVAERILAGATGGEPPPLPPIDILAPLD